jgi:hypothetical protein
MTAKKFTIYFVFGFMAYWFLGGLFYGFVFKSLLPAMPEGENADMMKFIFIGCMIMTLLFTFIYSRIGGLNSYKDAIVNGGMISLLIAAAMHTFYFMLMPGWTTTQRLIDLVINFIIGGLTSCIMLFAYSKLIKKAA